MGSGEQSAAVKERELVSSTGSHVLNMIFGTLCVAGGAGLLGIVVYQLYATGAQFYEGQFENHPLASLVLFIVMVSGMGAVAAGMMVLGVRLLLTKIRGAHLTAEFISLALALCALCELMLEGPTFTFWALFVSASVLIVVFSVMDPALSEERKLQRHLRQLEEKEEAEEGMLGRDETGRGFIALNFFNLFWIFTIAAFAGDIIETVYHYMIEVPGEFQIRAGLLWGPFSPIYGFGAVLLTLLLNRFYRANVVIIFLISAVVGGAFEYVVSWFLEFAFGAVAWDYTGRFLNIGGRTDFMFMCMWGVLGVIWIKWFLPGILDLVNRIPWKWRYTVTTICATLMIFDGVMTLMALDCWYNRLDGQPTDQLALTDFFANHFDNAYMSARFQSMSIDPSLTTRVNEAHSPL